MGGVSRRICWSIIHDSSFRIHHLKGFAMSVPREILDAVDHVEPLPQAATQLMQVVADKDHSASDVVKIVKCDNALTAAMLKAVNSAAFGMRSQVDSIDRAVGLLGDKLTMGIALGVCAAAVYNDPLDGYAARRGDLWRHSLFTAIAAREIAKTMQQRTLSPEKAYTAGMLHDIGKSVLSRFMHDSTQAMLEEIDNGKVQDYRQAEQEHFGTDHNEVGEALARRWSLPDELCAAIRFHHAPAAGEADFKPMIYAVHIADILAMMAGCGTGADSLLYGFDEHCEDYVKLDRQKQENLLFTVQLEFKKSADALNGNGG